MAWRNVDPKVSEIPTSTLGAVLYQRKTNMESSELVHTARDRGSEGKVALLKAT